MGHGVICFNTPDGNNFGKQICETLDSLTAQNRTYEVHYSTVVVSGVVQYSALIIVKP